MKKRQEGHKKSKVFCIAPWVHMHLLPDSRVIACCASNFDQEFGYLNKQSLEKVWNSKRARKMRVNIINDLPNEECKRCYELEKSAGWSLRKEINKKFSSHYNLVKGTKKGGFLDNVSMKYLDIRFSNICNFRCRTCDSYLSTGWQNDEKNMAGIKRSFPLLRLSKGAGGLDKWIEKNMAQIEEIYFAGGEPLISDEHYETLDKLLALGKRKIRLVYNTNFSTLSYKNKNVLDYWKKFSNVSACASLDDFGPRGELIRKGQNWKEIEKNIRKLKKFCPKVKFSISPTVSVLNVWHLADFHKYMVKKGYIKIDEIHLNILLFPPEYRVQVLPKSFKVKTGSKLARHINFLSNNKAGKRIISEYRQLVSFMNKDDQSSKYNDFLVKNMQIDSIRDEKFVEIFPEFKGFYTKEDIGMSAS